MKPRMYNNYDGFMYTVHNLSLGEVEYKGTKYLLDNKLERQLLFNELKLDGILESKIVRNHQYSEEVYKIRVDLVNEVFRVDSNSNGYLQYKAISLNLKEIFINRPINVRGNEHLEDIIL